MKTGKTHLGEGIETIWKYNDHEMEDKHEFIQWLFPTNESSRRNEHGLPVLTHNEIETFKSCNTCKENLKKSLGMMLTYYGLTRTNYNTISRDIGRWDTRRNQWFKPNNHNFDRISRIIRSLGLLGLTNERDLLYACVTDLQQYYPSITGDSYKYWTAAYFLQPSSSVHVH